MAIIKCQECGKEVSDKAKMCPGCGYRLKIKDKKPHIKKKMLILIAVLFFIIAGVGLAIYIMNPCVILGHSLSEATCENPETCTICGKTEGDPIGHEWIEATCEIPKTCSVCKKTEGDPIGHSTEVGVCTICKEFQGKDIVSSILTKIEEANRLWDLGFEVQTSTNISNNEEFYKAIKNGIPFYIRAQRKLNEALELCTGYDIFINLRKYLYDASTHMPIEVGGSDKTSLSNYEDALYTEIAMVLDYSVEAESIQEMLP